MIPRKFTRSELIDGAAAAFPRIRLVPDAVWAENTSLGAGSGTFLYACVTDPAETLEFLRFVVGAGWTARPLGAGTNLVGSDESTDGTIYLKPSGVLHFLLIRKAFQWGLKCLCRIDSKSSHIMTWQRYKLI